MKLLQIEKIHTDDNGSDIMTKTLPKEKLTVCRDIASIGSPTPYERTVWIMPKQCSSRMDIAEKGPVYVAMFKPLSIAIEVTMGVMFLGDTLHLGSVIGAIIISLGFYTVMWGKAKEEIAEDNEVGKVPLLQGYKNELV
ncbi:hypothetical protein LWI28_027487 [Acer negundo]|uniref:WAT1-related protein n=1 Tax=Acer negundo TaxID=4023 RepID=A0AAD5IWB7_ACENE|nr:hypothetical protein LWI28_027487 [Acer negundo]